MSRKPQKEPVQTTMRVNAADAGAAIERAHELGWICEVLGPAAGQSTVTSHRSTLASFQQQLTQLIGAPEVDWSQVSEADLSKLSTIDWSKLHVIDALKDTPFHHTSAPLVFFAALLLFMKADKASHDPCVSITQPFINLVYTIILQSPAGALTQGALSNKLTAGNTAFRVLFSILAEFPEHTESCTALAIKAVEIVNAASNTPETKAWEIPLTSTDPDILQGDTALRELLIALMKSPQDKTLRTILSSAIPHISVGAWFMTIREDSPTNIPRKNIDLLWHIFQKSPEDEVLQRLAIQVFTKIFETYPDHTETKKTIEYIGKTLPPAAWVTAPEKMGAKARNIMGFSKFLIALLKVGDAHNVDDAHMSPPPTPFNLLFCALDTDRTLNTDGMYVLSNAFIKIASIIMPTALLDKKMTPCVDGKQYACISIIMKAFSYADTKVEAVAVAADAECAITMDLTLLKRYFQAQTNKAWDPSDAPDSESLSQLVLLLVQHSGAEQCIGLARLITQKACTKAKHTIHLALTTSTKNKAVNTWRDMQKDGDGGTAASVKSAQTKKPKTSAAKKATQDEIDDASQNSDALLALEKETTKPRTHNKYVPKKQAAQPPTQPTPAKKKLDMPLSQALKNIADSPTENGALIELTLPRINAETLEKLDIALIDRLFAALYYYEHNKNPKDQFVQLILAITTQLPPKLWETRCCDSDTPTGNEIFLLGVLSRFVWEYPENRVFLTLLDCAAKNAERTAWCQTWQETDDNTWSPLALLTDRLCWDWNDKREMHATLLNYVTRKILTQHCSMENWPSGCQLHYGGKTGDLDSVLRQLAILFASHTTDSNLLHALTFAISNAPLEAWQQTGIGQYEDSSSALSILTEKLDTPAMRATNQPQIQQLLRFIKSQQKSTLSGNPHTLCADAAPTPKKKTT